MSHMELLYNRKSIRNYKEGAVPKEDIMKMIEAATMAPSPKHQQNWHFVLLSNRAKIEELTRIVSESHMHIASLIEDEKERNKYIKLLPYYTNFRDSESVVLVYSKEYEMIEETILRNSGVSQEVVESLLAPQSAAQAIGAAIENFLLAATDMGYGACYMTGPTHAKEQIEELIHIPVDNYHLMAMISVGIPADEKVRQPRRRPIEEVVTFID